MYVYMHDKTNSFCNHNDKGFGMNIHLLSAPYSTTYSYRQTSNINHTKSQKFKCFSFRLAIVFAQSIEAMC